MQEEYQDTFIVKTNKKSFKFETPYNETSIHMIQETEMQPVDDDSYNTIQTPKELKIGNKISLNRPKKIQYGSNHKRHNSMFCGLNWNVILNILKIQSFGVLGFRV